MRCASPTLSEQDSSNQHPVHNHRTVAREQPQQHNNHQREPHHKQTMAAMIYRSKHQKGTMAKKYEQREMPHKVSVATLPNGYAFTVDGKEYLCFSAEQLVNEVFVRLALGELEYMNKDTIAAVLEAAAKWQDLKDALMANAELIASARRAHANEIIALGAQAKANERAEELQRERDRLWNENVNLRMEIEQLEIKLKKFDKILVGNTAKPEIVTKDTKLTKGQREAHKRKKK